MTPRLVGVSISVFFVSLVLLYVGLYVPKMESNRQELEELTEQIDEARRATLEIDALRARRNALKTLVEQTPEDQEARLRGAPDDVAEWLTLQLSDYGIQLISLRPVAGTNASIDVVSDGGADDFSRLFTDWITRPSDWQVQSVTMVRQALGGSVRVSLRLAQGEWEGRP